VRITKIDRDRNLIEGKIGSWTKLFSCKVIVRLYASHPEMSLVEFVIEAPRKHQKPELLSICLNTLERNFESAMPVDVLAVVNREVKKVEEEVKKGNIQNRNKFGRH